MKTPTYRHLITALLILVTSATIHAAPTADGVKAQQRTTKGSASTKPGGGQVSTPRPNIVHIMIDDLGWQDIASHKLDGKPVYETPHMDRMTRIGRRFTQAYSPAPTCAPSRVSFLRG